MGKYIKKDVPVFNVSDIGGCDYNKVICPVSGKEVWVFAKDHNRLSDYEYKSPEQLIGKGCRWHSDPAADKNCPYSVCGFEEDGRKFRRCKIPKEELQQSIEVEGEAKTEKLLVNIENKSVAVKSKTNKQTNFNQESLF